MGKEKPPRRTVSQSTAPQPKEFRVHVRITTTREKDVAVQAMTKTEAREKARAAVENEGGVRVTEVSAT